MYIERIESYAFIFCLISYVENIKRKDICGMFLFLQWTFPPNNFRWIFEKYFKLFLWGVKNTNKKEQSRWLRSTQLFYEEREGNLQWEDWRKIEDQDGWTEYVSLRNGLSRDTKDELKLLQSLFSLFFSSKTGTPFFCGLGPPFIFPLLLLFQLFIILLDLRGS